MTTVTDQQHKWLLRKFHSLCNRLGLDAETKLAMIDGYGVESSKDMSNAELTELCRRLEQSLDPDGAKREQLKRRVMGAIGGWLRLIGKESDLNYIKSVACRAAGVDYFNKIPTEKLRNIYSLFLKKQRDAKAVNDVCGEITYTNRFGRKPDATN